MILDILIPQYKEDEKMIGTLLNSIALQQSIDFNDIQVIIVNDGSNVLLSDNFLNAFPFKIQYIKNPHLGIGATRNTALEHASAPYLMFCDADDMFYHNLAFNTIFSILEEYPNVTFLESLIIDTHEKELGKCSLNESLVTVHGKIYKRQFLIDNHITWDTELKYNEDVNFNLLCYFLTIPENFLLYQIPFYLHRDRNNSITDIEHFPILSLPHLLAAWVKTLTRLTDNNEVDHNMLADFIFSTFYKLYFIEQSTSFKEYKQAGLPIDEIEKSIHDYIKQFYNYFDDFTKTLTPEEQITLANLKLQSENDYYGEITIKYSSIEDWLAEKMR